MSRREVLLRQKLSVPLMTPSQEIIHAGRNVSVEDEDQLEGPQTKSYDTSFLRGYFLDNVE